MKIKFYSLIERLLPGCRPGLPLLFLFTGLLCASPRLLAQSSTVSGTVKEESGQAVTGATVFVKGSANGTTTDLSGNYTLRNVVPSDTIAVTYLGFKMQQEVAGTRTRIDFILEEEIEALEQVVVVGYGTLKKRHVVGSVENLSGEALQDRTNAFIARSLQGQIPGLNIVQLDGKPSHQGNIYIRGGATNFYTKTNPADGAVTQRTLGQGGSALVLIDGVEGDLSTVNPDDVETVAVLKDASSSAIYGARGAFGVIMVTTKNPSGGKVKVNYTGNVAVNRRTVIWEDHVVDDGVLWSDFL